MALHTYQDLDQVNKAIRLIRIEPGFASQPVYCTMITVSLHDRPITPYETISYVWGDAATRGTVFVNGNPLSVPLSAEKVIKRVRHPDRHRTVWIDSLCIDQSSTSDRNYQVPLMCDIYSSSIRGLVWLGEDHGMGQEVIVSLQALYSEARRDSSNFENFKSMVWPGWWDPYGAPSQLPCRAELLAQFFNLPWFSRLWVVQEAALAPASSCYYGEHAIPLLVIQRAAIWLYSKSKSTNSLLTGHAGLARAVHLASYTDELFTEPFRSSNNLLWMLNTLKQYSTSRAEDHVYGLVGMYQQFLLQGQSLPQSLMPDYGSPLSSILGNATKTAIDELRRLDPLLYVCHRTAEELEQTTIPSWIPRWDRKQDLTIDHFPLNYRQFKAAQSTQAHLQLNENSAPGKLDVVGFTLDSIQKVSPAFSHATLSNRASLLDLLISAQSLINGLNDAEEHLHHVLVASLDHKMKPMSHNQSARGFVCLLRHLTCEKNVPIVDDFSGSNDSTSAAAYHEALMRWMRNRRLFITTKGYIGSGPQILQNGDLVTILHGSKMPMILRASGYQGTQQVIGQAYVSGLMYGEAFDAHQGCGKQDTRFTCVWQN